MRAKIFSLDEFYKAEVRVKPFSRMREGHMEMISGFTRQQQIARLRGESPSSPKKPLKITNKLLKQYLKYRSGVGLKIVGDKIKMHRSQQESPIQVGPGGYWTNSGTVEEYKQYLAHDIEAGKYSVDENGYLIKAPRIK